MQAKGQETNTTGRRLLTWNYPIPEILVITLALAIHLFNLPGFPSYFIDEGTYTNRAILFEQTGDPTAPAGSFYFHPFLVWTLLGGLFSTLNFPRGWNGSPQLLYLLPRLIFVAFGVLDAILIYFVTLRVYRRRDYALLSSGLLAVTPLSVRYLRMVLLDSVMLFFVLVSLAILVRNFGKKQAALSGAVFGLGMLSKLPAIFFILPFALLIASKDKVKFSSSWNDFRHSLSPLVLWLVAAGLVTAVWPIYAVGTGQLKGLMTSLSYQSSREGALAFDLIIARLLERDVFLFVGVAGILYGLWRRDIVGGFFATSYLGTFVVASFRVSSYYLVPALPFLSVIATRLVTDGFEYLSRQLSKYNMILPRLSFKIVGLVLLAVLTLAGFALANQTSTGSQTNAMNYVIKNAPDGALVISSPTYSWVVHESRNSLVVYDWFGAPWNSLPSSPPKTYLIVDPGFSTAIPQVPELQLLFNSTQTEKTFSERNFTVEIRTSSTLSFPLAG